MYNKENQLERSVWSIQREARYLTPVIALTSIKAVLGQLRLQTGAGSWLLRMKLLFAFTVVDTYPKPFRLCLSSAWRMRSARIIIIAIEAATLTQVYSGSFNSSLNLRRHSYFLVFCACIILVPKVDISIREQLLLFKVVFMSEKLLVWVIMNRLHNTLRPRTTIWT